MPECKIRVGVTNKMNRSWKNIKDKLGPDVLRVQDLGGGLTFEVTIASEENRQTVEHQLTGMNLATLTGGQPQPTHRGPAPGGYGPVNKSAHGPAPVEYVDVKQKPYGFIALPETFTVADAVWHDGSSSVGRISGEVRFEITNLTPLLVGWERRCAQEDSKLRAYLDQTFGPGTIPDNKSVLCPLRAPWGEGPVIIPGDSLKGLLRQELGALLGAPLERVAERSYSYRPNSLFPDGGSRLIPRLARVPQNGCEMFDVRLNQPVPVPQKLELLNTNLRFVRNGHGSPPFYQFDPPGGGGQPYRGGMGAGQMLLSKKPLHRRVEADPKTVSLAPVPSEVQQGYLNTLRHLTDPESGHFSERHPDISDKKIPGDAARARILDAARNEVFKPGDIVWVEWDTVQERIVSIGWHYYYRWAYQDTIRRSGAEGKRPGLFPLAQETTSGNDEHIPPPKLSAVRRLFGYTGDNEGSKGIGKGNYSQLMGRVAMNSALEVVQGTDEDRFLRPAFLKELGVPRPSAVEFYLDQPYARPGAHRPSDGAWLVTYGDTNFRSGYDSPGRLAGRKFYLDRANAENTAEDDSENKNERSTLALQASRRNRCFRFTVRFRDVDPSELAAILLAFCPNQFSSAVNGTHKDGYCSKLGYARPLGWGSVRIEAKELYLIEQRDGKLGLEKQPADLIAYVKEHLGTPPMLKPWLDIHRRNHPDAADYQKKNGEIYTFHADIRAKHTRYRRRRV